MNSVRSCLVVVAFIALLLVPMEAAYAQRGGRGGRGGGGGGGGGGGAPPRPDPNTNPQVIADRAEISALQTEMTRISRQIDVATQALTAEFEKTPEHLDAKKKLDAANAEMAAARAEVVKALKAKPDYKAALEREAGAKAKLEQLRARNAARDLIAAQSQEILTAGGVVSKLEREAVAIDAHCIAAQKSQSEALAAMKLQKDALAEKNKSNPELTELRNRLAETRTKLAEANKKLTQDFAAASQG